MTCPPHWSYYYSLEDDLVELSRYVSICEDNFLTYSTQLTRLLLAAASEADVVAKTLCTQLDPQAKRKNIEDYRQVIAEKRPAIKTMKLGIEGSEIALTPWESWGADSPESPAWWQGYNSVKHDRHANFRKGNLQNALNAVAGLFCFVRHLKEDEGRPKPNRFLRIL